MIHFGRALGLRSLGSSKSSSRQTAWKMSVASSEEKPYLMGIEKMRFLYLSIRADQAASVPLRHSCTSRVSGHAVRCSSLAKIFRCTGGSRPPQLSGRITLPRSTKRKDRESRDENSRCDPWRQRECPDSPDKSREDFGRQFAGLDRTDACAFHSSR